jgi:alkanesulfonate monooxygenase SsuD/methylene tetrahydromethanopterin reductase-like flavin-dependent oxidoreductase (luciferase family)
MSPALEQMDKFRLSGTFPSLIAAFLRRAGGIECNSLDTHVSKWDCIKNAEDLGYDRAWVPDSRMIWSDCYATLALAAVNTKLIHIGTGVAIPGTRIAPVTAHSVASINELAPGRVFLGIGTGHTGMRVIGTGSDAG